MNNDPIAPNEQQSGPEPQPVVTPQGQPTAQQVEGAPQQIVQPPNSVQQPNVANPQPQPQQFSSANQSPGYVEGNQPGNPKGKGKRILLIAVISLLIIFVLLFIVPFLVFRSVAGNDSVKDADTNSLSGTISTDEIRQAKEDAYQRALAADKRVEGDYTIENSVSQSKKLAQICSDSSYPSILQSPEGFKRGANSSGRYNSSSKEISYAGSEFLPIDVLHSYKLNHTELIDYYACLKPVPGKAVATSTVCQFDEFRDGNNVDKTLYNIKYEIVIHDLAKKQIVATADVTSDSGSSCPFATDKFSSDGILNIEQSAIDSERAAEEFMKVLSAN